MCESSIKEAVGSVGSEAVGLYLKGKLFTISRESLPLGGVMPPGQQGPRCQSIRLQEIKDVVNTVSREVAVSMVAGAAAIRWLDWG